jgi:hypothetical protein
LKFDNESFNPPIYDFYFLSIFGCIKNNLPRTSNGAKVWHKKMKERYQIKHPNIAYFLNGLLDEEVLSRVKLIQAKIGEFDFSRVDYKKEYKLMVW